jgi:hypothetical protein
MFISLGKRSLEQRFFSTAVIGVFVYHECTMRRHAEMAGLYNNFFSNLSLWASNFLDWLVRIKKSLVRKLSNLSKAGQWVVMCIVTITLPVQIQDNTRSCVLLPLYYLYKARTMSGHVYCYHYSTCTNPGKWAVMCIVAITLPVPSQVNERSCVLLPLHYLYKAM